MKPFRFLNKQSVTTIYQKMLPGFQAWHTHYACKELTFSLEKSAEDPELTPLETIHPAVQAEKNWYGIFSLCLFGEDNPAFYTACEKIASHLFTHLGLQEFTDPPTKDWFYTGSSCLTMHLSCDNKSVNWYLHPDWVYNQLSEKSVGAPLVSLEKALHQETITLEALLQPFALSLHTLLDMETGDLLQTDHALSQPLQLTLHSRIVAEARLAETTTHPSILIERFL